jgi:acetamidase/formamidase
MQVLGLHASECYDLVAAEPALIVDQGERFAVETEDALGGLIAGEQDPPTAAVLGAALAEDRFNPCAGPIWVRGAVPGDTLAVTIHAIDPAPGGVTPVFEGLGPLADSARWPRCRGPFTAAFEYRAADRSVAYGAHPPWAADPHIGTLAVAAARGLSAGADSNYGQGPFGGNLDCREFAPGHTVLLPVAVAGACLYVGDVHTAMADGELLGCGIEARARVTLSCARRAGAAPPFARIETPSLLVQLCSARPLEQAIEQAFRWMLEWLVDEHGLDSRDAYVLLGVHPAVRISVFQVVRIGRLNATVGVSFPRALL